MIRTGITNGCRPFKSNGRFVAFRWTLVYVYCKNLTSTIESFFPQRSFQQHSIMELLCGPIAGNEVILERLAKFWTSFLGQVIISKDRKYVIFRCEDGVLFLCIVDDIGEVDGTK